MKKILFLIILFSIGLYSQDHNLKQIKEKIEENYYTFNYKKLDNILIECKNINKNSWQKNYYLGMLHLLMGKIIYNDDNDKAYEHFDNSVSNFEKAYELGLQQALGAIQQVQQMLGQAPQQANPNDPQAAFEAFQQAGSLDAMRQTVEQFPVLAQMIPTIQQVIQQQVPPDQRPAFEQRLAWLQQIVEGN